MCLTSWAPPASVYTCGACEWAKHTFATNLDGSLFITTKSTASSSSSSSSLLLRLLDRLKKLIVCGAGLLRFSVFI